MGLVGRHPVTRTAKGKDADFLANKSLIICAEGGILEWEQNKVELVWKLLGFSERRMGDRESRTTWAPTPTTGYTIRTEIMSTSLSDSVQHLAYMRTVQLTAQQLPTWNRMTDSFMPVFVCSVHSDLPLRSTLEDLG